MINKNFAELLCKIAWKDANNNKKESIDNWIKTIFDTKFDEFTKHVQKAAYITKKNAEKLCRIAWWDTRVNFDVYPSVQKWLNEDFLKMTEVFKKNISKN